MNDIDWQTEQFEHHRRHLKAVAYRMLGSATEADTFKPRVLAATPGQEFRWLGKLGSRRIFAGQHFFVLTTNDDGTTRLHHGERFSGVLVARAKGSSGKGAAGYEAFSAALKQCVEQLRQPRQRQETSVPPVSGCETWIARVSR